jgi:hypothetical protein
MTAAQLRDAEVSGRKVLSKEENFLGTHWWFVTAIGGNYWYFRRTGHILLASSTWVKTGKSR